MLLFAVRGEQLDFELVKVDGLGEMLLRVKRAAELLPFAVMLGQLQRALHVEAAAKLQKGGLDIPVVNLDGFVFYNAVAA